MSIIMLSINSCDDLDQTGSALAELALMAGMGGKLPARESNPDDLPVWGDKFRRLPVATLDQRRV